MDLITQGILGAAIAEAGWRKELGRGAIFAGVLFGLMPDFDVVSGLWGEWVSMVHHRGFTHSVFFAPLVAGPGGWACWRLSGRRGKLQWWITLAFWVLLTHPLLDVFTTYGTQLLAPISDRRFALDGVSIIDPLYTFPLIGALLVAWIWRTKPDRGRRATSAALVATTLYLGLGFGMATDARAEAIAQLARADYPEMAEVRATPTFANLLLWRIVARDARGDIHVGLHSRVADQTTIPFQTVARPDTPLIERAMEHERTRLFHWFAMDMVSYELEEGPEQVTLHMYDQRYGGVRDPTHSFWGADAIFDASGAQLQRVERVRDTGGRQDIRAELRALWRAIWNGPPQPPSGS